MVLGVILDVITLVLGSIGAIAAFWRGGPRGAAGLLLGRSGRRGAASVLEDQLFILMQAGLYLT
jgi:hypothetical protein